MDVRAKQRLTGAIILVALFVLLVPELLTGPKSANAPAAPGEEGLRRYTIDLGSPATNPGDTPPAAEPQVSLPPVATTRPDTGLAQPGEAAVPEPSPTPEPAEPRPSATAPPPAATAQASPPPATRPAPATASVPASPTIPKGHFVVQLGSFSSRDNAERLMRDMTAKGFTTFIAPITLRMPAASPSEKPCSVACGMK